MRHLNEYIIENQMITKGKIKDLIKKVKIKIFHARTVKELKSEEKFLEEYVNNIETIKEVGTHFDISNQEDTGVVLGEYGGLNSISSEIDSAGLSVTEEKNLRELMKQSDKWKLCKNNQDFVWFLPALQAWNIDINSLNEDICIESFMSCYATGEYQN